MKIAINVQFGGFGLSEKAYERMIELGVPVQKYELLECNNVEIIFDRLATPEAERDILDDTIMRLTGRYWETWTDHARNHPLVIRVIEELGDVANGPHAKLKIVEIPDGVEYTIEEYDGKEHIAEKHRTWE